MVNVLVNALYTLPITVGLSGSGNDFGCFIFHLNIQFHSIAPVHISFQ